MNLGSIRLTSIYLAITCIRGRLSMIYIDENIRIKLLVLLATKEWTHKDLSIRLRLHTSSISKWISGSTKFIRHKNWLVLVYLLEPFTCIGNRRVIFEIDSATETDKIEYAIKRLEYSNISLSTHIMPKIPKDNDTNMDTDMGIKHLITYLSMPENKRHEIKAMLTDPMAYDIIKKG